MTILAGFLVFWQFGGLTDSAADPPIGPVLATAPPINPAAIAPCQKLIDSLPPRVAGADRREVAATNDKGFIAAWGNPPIIVRCGVSQPKALTNDAQIFGINGVEWVAESKKDLVVWTTVSLAYPVEVQVPNAYRDDTAAHILNPLAAPLLSSIR